MSVGFRSGLFGFNKKDVIEYIKKAAEEAKYKENELSKALEKEKNQNTILEKTNKELSERLAKFEEKCNEITAMCENISRLYLTTKISSQAIMDSTEENCKVMQSQIENNLSTIEEVQSALSRLKEQVVQTADVYTKEVDSVSDCLETAKEVINTNKSEADQAIKNFNEALNK